MPLALRARVEVLEEASTPSGPFNGDNQMNSKSAFRFLRHARFALSGAILGAAIIGLFSQNTLSLDVLGATLGFFAVVLAERTHLI